MKLGTVTPIDDGGKACAANGREVPVTSVQVAVVGTHESWAR